MLCYGIHAQATHASGQIVAVATCQQAHAAAGDLYANILHAIVLEPMQLPTTVASLSAQAFLVCLGPKWLWAIQSNGRATRCMVALQVARAGQRLPALPGVEAGQDALQGAVLQSLRVTLNWLRRCSQEGPKAPLQVCDPAGML